MDQIYSLTEAKTKLSEIINRVHFRKEKFTITKKGKAVAVIAPCNEVSGEGDAEGLIRARGALSEIDTSVDDMVDDIYAARTMEIDRKVEF